MDTVLDWCKHIYSSIYQGEKDEYTVCYKCIGNYFDLKWIQEDKVKSNHINKFECSMLIEEDIADCSRRNKFGDSMSMMEDTVYYIRKNKFESLMLMVVDK